MFSVKEKRKIAQAIEKLLLDLNHPEMPKDKPKFQLHVVGKNSWSWADIEPNWVFDDGHKEINVNPFNEVSRELHEGVEPIQLECIYCGDKFGDFTIKEVNKFKPICTECQKTKFDEIKEKMHKATSGKKLYKEMMIKVNCVDCIHYPDDCRNYRDRGFYACSEYEKRC